MSTQYQGNVALFPLEYAIPDDGDNADAASVNVSQESLGDRTALLYETLIGDGVDWDVIQRQVNIQAASYNSNAYFAMADDGALAAATHWLQTDKSGVGGLCFQLVPPYHGAILTSVVARIHGGLGGGHAAWPVATMPQIIVYAVRDGVRTNWETVTDASAQVVYEAVHDIGTTGLGGATRTAAYNDTLWVVFRGETGLNSENNELGLYSIRTYWSRVPTI